MQLASLQVARRPASAPRFGKPLYIHVYIIYLCMSERERRGRGEEEERESREQISKHYP